jgi:hypothetical protein
MFRPASEVSATSITSQILQWFSPEAAHHHPSTLVTLGGAPFRWNNNWLRHTHPNDKKMDSLFFQLKRRGTNISSMILPVT